MNEFVRTELLLGAEAMEKLKNSRVAVFGVGGVGGYAVEALARSGVGALELIDDDKALRDRMMRAVPNMKPRYSGIMIPPTPENELSIRIRDGTAARDEVFSENFLQLFFLLFGCRRHGKTCCCIFNNSRLYQSFFNKRHKRFTNRVNIHQLINFLLYFL